MLAVILAISWFAGVASVAAWGAPAWLAGATAACGIPVLARFAGSRYALLGVAAAIVALAGAARFDGWASQPVPVLVNHAGETVTISGTIEGLPDQGLTVRRYRMDADTVETETGDGPRDVSGGVLLTTPQHTELEPGARVTARGEFELAPVFEGFDYRSFLLRRGIAGTMFFPETHTVANAPATAVGPAIERLRANLEGALQRALPEPEASLAAGITIGRDGTIPEGLYEDFRRSGLAHVLAVSGSNIVVITALAFWGLTPLFGRRVALWPAMAMTGGYVVLAGADASILRAGLMAGIFLFGEYLGRQQSGLAALGLTGVILTAWQPSMALDIGFQLSFAATAGLMVFTPWIRYGLEWSLRRAGMLALVPQGVTMVIALSIATTLAIVPLLWINFGAVSVVGPIANVIAEVLFLAVLATGLLCGFAGLISPELGWATGLLAYYPAAALRWTAEAFGGLPFAIVEVPEANATWAIAAYCVLAIPGWFAYRYLAPELDRGPPTQGNVAMRRVALGAGGSAAIAVVVLHSLAPMQGPGELRVTMLDVGQGDALLVETPGGGQVLVDAGPSGMLAARELSEVLPHWDRRLDAVLVTHPHQDHIAGMAEVFARYDVARAYDTGFVRETGAVVAYQEDAPARTMLRAGDTLELDGVRFDVLWPPSDYTDEWNNMSLVVRVEYGEVRVLLTGDLEGGHQRELLEAGTDVMAQVLKEPHQGSSTSDAGFLEAVGAGVALLPVGEGNQYGHPHAETLELLSETVLLRSDEHGRVTVATDGTELRVDVEHPTR